MFGNKMDVYYPGRVSHQCFYQNIFHNCPVFLSIICHSQLKLEKRQFENVQGVYLKTGSWYEVLKLFKDPFSAMYAPNAWTLPQKSKEAIKKRSAGCDTDK